MANKPTTAADAASPASPLGAPDRTVRFVKRYDRYNKGEVAGFGQPMAEKLIRLGLAVDAAAGGGPAMIRK